MKEIRSLIPVKPDGLDEIAGELLKPATTAPLDTSIDLREFLRLETVDPNLNPIELLVEKYPIKVDKRVKQVLTSLDYKLVNKDASGDILSGDYSSENIWVPNRLGYLHWFEQLPLLEHFNSQRLTLRQFKDFISLLKEAKDGRKKLYDGLGSIVDENEINKILDVLIKKEDPWRSEYLDTKFEVKNDKVILHEGHYVDNTNLSLPLEQRIKAKYKKEIDKDSILMQDGFTSFKYLNDYGLATKIEGNEVYYSYPSNNAVAGFSADSDWAGLVCDRNPGDSDGALGVRRAILIK